MAQNIAPPSFELDTWASHYEGPLLPLRLVHMATACPALRNQALELALSIAKAGKDVQLYNKLCEMGDVRPDAAWAEQQYEDNQRQLAKMESELKGYKNNLIRESIRMGQEDLATHHLVTGGPVPEQGVNYHRGGYAAAYEAFAKMRDYCTTPTHVNSMTLRMIHTAAVQAVHAQQISRASAGNYFSALQANAARLLTSGTKVEEQEKLTPIAHVAVGIAHLGQSDYPAAARSFLRAPFDYHNLGPVFGADMERLLASANDVAIYGGLCALATMSRQDLIDNVLGGPFRQFLEQEPHMRKAIGLYTTAKYQACIDTLHRYYPDWSLDIFLGASSSPESETSHVDALFARIRERSITAYFSAFSEVKLDALAATFPPLSNDPKAMENEALRMIQNKTLDARIDMVKGVLVAPRKELRVDAHAKAKKAAEEVERTLLLRLHRVNMVLAGLEIPKTHGWDNSNSSRWG
jgi:COP9 signalosome complex subunit 1